MEIRLCIIIPVYNPGKLLFACLDSVVAQSVPAAEVILVDDGSTDGSAAVCEAYAAAHANVVLIKKANGGVSSARNAGLDACHSDYVTFLDSDDTIAPNTVELLLDALGREQPDLLLSDAFQFDDGRVLRSGWQLTGRVARDAAIAAYLGLDVTISACRTVYRRTLIGNERFRTDVHFYEDMEFQLRMFSHADVLSRVDAPYYTYTQGSVTHAHLSERTLTAFIAADAMETLIERMFPALRTAFFNRAAYIAMAVTVVGAMDHGHDPALDARIRAFAKKLLCTVQENRLRLSPDPKRKLWLLSLSPRLVYAILRMKNGW